MVPKYECRRGVYGGRSLARFVDEAWHAVEPAATYIHSWHVDATCEHLEAVTNGQIRNLIINMPPRHMKSLLASVFWPCWDWTLHPERRWIFASYAQSLATRDSLKCRRLINSAWSVFHLIVGWASLPVGQSTVDLERMSA
jgi:hypothetical protein